MKTYVYKIYSSRLDALKSNHLRRTFSEATSFAKDNNLHFPLLTKLPDLALSCLDIFFILWYTRSPNLFQLTWKTREMENQRKIDSNLKIFKKTICRLYHFEPNVSFYMKSSIIMAVERQCLNSQYSTHSLKNSTKTTHKHLLKFLT